MWVQNLNILQAVEKNEICKVMARLYVDRGL